MGPPLIVYFVRPFDLTGQFTEHLLRMQCGRGVGSKEEQGMLLALCGLRKLVEGLKHKNLQSKH
jgi:hypothetical protein